MNMKNLKIAEELVKTAELILADSDYIYDPDHKKHPGGGYHKTEKGWSKLDEKEEEGGSSNKSTEKKDDGNSGDKKETSEKPNKNKVTRKVIEDKVNSLPKEKKQEIAEDEKAPKMLLDILSNDDDCKLSVASNKSTHTKTLDKLATDKDNNVRNQVALNENTSAETLDKLSNDKDKWLRKNVAMNPNTNSKTLGKLVEDKNYVVYHAVSNNPNAEREQLEYLHQRIMDEYEEDKQNAEKSLEQGGKFNSANRALLNIAKHKNAKGDTLDQIAQTFPKGNVIGDAARDNLKERGDYNPNVYGDKVENIQNSKLPKYKFKGDDKTAPIIRAKFEKDQNKEETDVIYGEMAKFSRDNVAPMGVYHGRTKEQLKADFIKNMNPSNYASPESFKNAQDRIRKMSAQDFSRILASIFAEEDEEI